MTELDLFVLRMPPGYTRKLASVEQGVYWHLHLDGERINGGLAVTEQRALEDSRRYALAHMWSVLGDSVSSTGHYSVLDWDD